FTIETPYSQRKPIEILADELIEDRMQTNRRVLTVDDALQMAVLHSREYQTAKEQLYLKALSLTGAKHAFSPQFFATADASWTRTFREVQYKDTNGVVVRTRIDDKGVGSVDG